MYPQKYEKKFLLLFSKEFVKKVKYFSRGCLSNRVPWDMHGFPSSRDGGGEKEGGEEDRKRRKRFHLSAFLLSFLLCFPRENTACMCAKKGGFSLLPLPLRDKNLKPWKKSVNGRDVKSFLIHLRKI